MIYKLWVCPAGLLRVPAPTTPLELIVEMEITFGRYFTFEVIDEIKDHIRMVYQNQTYAKEEALRPGS